MHNLSCENEFYFHENEKGFPCQSLINYPRFETEARRNSQIGYFSSRGTLWLVYAVAWFFAKCCCNWPLQSSLSWELKWNWKQCLCNILGWQRKSIMIWYFLAWSIACCLLAILCCVFTSLFRSGAGKCWLVSIPLQGCAVGKMEGAQCSELVKSSVPSIEFVWKSRHFLVVQCGGRGEGGSCGVVMDTSS